MPVVLDASTIVLLNVYAIMGLQLGLNWSNTDCNTRSYLFQLGFILLMTTRLFFHELYNNQKLGKGISAAFNFLLSGLLLALGIYQAVTIVRNSSYFYFKAETIPFHSEDSEGNETCFQNRIVFVGEIIIICLTVLKDIYFVFFGGQNGEEVKPA